MDSFCWFAAASLETFQLKLDEFSPRMIAIVRVAGPGQSAKRREVLVRFDISFGVITGRIRTGGATELMIFLKLLLHRRLSFIPSVRPPKNPCALA